MLYHLGRREEAVSAFRKALSQRPGFGRASDFLDYLRTETPTNSQ
jgi:hypothetical protein